MLLLGHLFHDFPSRPDFEDAKLRSELDAPIGDINMMIGDNTPWTKD